MNKWWNLYFMVVILAVTGCATSGLTTATSTAN